jgi:hypothetical protein
VPPNKPLVPTGRAASLRSAARPAAQRPIVRRAKLRCVVTRVNILADETGAGWAAAMSRLLSRGGHEVSRIVRPVFPTGDALPARLQQGEVEADVALVVLTPESKNANWVSSELSLAGLYARHLLCLAPRTHFPRSWTPTSPRLLLPGDDPSARVSWLASSVAPLPARGAVVELCDHCAMLLPSAKSLPAHERARIRSLCTSSPSLARAEFMAATRCPEDAARLWVEHDGRASDVRPGPACPGCGVALPTSRSRQCLRCGADWHHLALEAAEQPAAPDGAPVPRKLGTAPRG